MAAQHRARRYQQFHKACPPFTGGAGLFLFILLLLPGLPSQAAQEAASPLPRLPEAEELIHEGGFLLGSEKNIVAAYGVEKPLIPASIIKIATAAASRHILGPGYRFKTEFFQNSEGELFIKGWGDPMLISEEVAAMAPALARSVQQPISGLIIDNSAFQLLDVTSGRGTSLNPYDAGVNALAVNFNTVNIEVSGRGEVRSAEPQTPTLPVMARLAKGLVPGSHRINISNAPREPLHAAGELFWRLALSPTDDNSPPPPIRAGTVPQGLEPLYIHTSSHDLDSIIKAMLLYSNNFIANQLFLACGAESQGFPADWAKADTAVSEFLVSTAGLEAGSFYMVEGSGLSRRNRITPRAMLRLLEYYSPWAASLPRKNGDLLKSGTLTGVSSYAGYLGHAQQPVIIILNQKQNRRDQLLTLLRSHLSGL